MATPDFILSLREKIGHDLLWLPGVSIVVVDGDGRLLLGRRSDNGRWAVVSGIPEPGEQPAAAAVRECEEETGVVPEVLAVVDVGAGEPMTFPNGDACAFMDISFVGRVGPAEAARVRVADDESTEVGWFHPDRLPSPMVPSSLGRIESALAWLAEPASGARFHF
ncbi:MULTISPECIES: NUDIX domain-containing protein [unclassified Actinomyces]|uniref:NUDIX hydrolase n=1 Tax=unclassified Actinomyces TaxID=2609248 RepID=UPI0020174FC1|nr:MULTISPECIES: NUDIX domain-containing protein [unclassified Actinomyces]MCL3778471.1 NUDIX domain-containing protein [Actinomyces sp. AC-20-1]MCL3789304.1 NUDIX domain-containing protein [Actinomyces sp. 187325]MCL3792072.1 NUDIX domain-containing protein [Actinomyces sp. 186855]MCL3793971.1 NUDIX domain-containing protein [Actinomyces sp. 217892]